MAKWASINQLESLHSKIILVLYWFNEIMTYFILTRHKFDHVIKKACHSKRGNMRLDHNSTIKSSLPDIQNLN
jgi:hypothetical protein